MADDRRSAVDVLRGSRILAYSVGALTLIAGIVLLVWTDRSVVVVARIAGILVLVIGLSEAFEAITTHRKGSYWGLFLLRGLINIGFGAALLFWPEISVTVVVWLFGLDLVITAVLGLILSTQVPKEQGRSSMAVRSLVGLGFGIAIMVWPSATLTIVAWIVGLQLILGGLILLWSGYQLSKAEVVEV